MPFPRDDPTLSRGLEGHTDQAFLDQHFLPGVLTIPVCIDPSSKLLAVIRVEKGSPVEEWSPFSRGNGILRSSGSGDTRPYWSGHYEPNTLLE